MNDNIDIKENDIKNFSSKVLDTLLIDRTMKRHYNVDAYNIFWATKDYEALGEGFLYNDQIKAENITGEHGNIIQPRTCKSAEVQQLRSKDKAEVFTPTWICNAQNNLIDNEWFGRENVFNTENDDHTWTVNEDRIVFPEGKTWKDYVNETRLEITCGEAPYITSRYDAVTGDEIPLERRIGLLDRKLRVVSENTSESGEWLAAAQDAFRSVYGYEWQGDSLLIARENLLFTFIDFYKAKFGAMPLEKSVNFIAYIISWNLWQMDGLKGVVPGTCYREKIIQTNLFEESDFIYKECDGCKKGIMKNHNGVKCLIRNWRKSSDKQIEIFIDSIK